MSVVTVQSRSGEAHTGADRDMPTYEYLCKTCGTQFEVFQSFHDKPLKTHDGCGGPVQKVFHASGIVFKGSGFYATDSRGSSSTKSSSKSTGSDQSTGKGSDSGKDTSSSSSSTKAGSDD